VTEIIDEDPFARASNMGLKKDYSGQAFKYISKLRGDPAKASNIFLNSEVIRCLCRKGIHKWDLPV
jgi:hypothetical protein